MSLLITNRKPWWMSLGDLEEGPHPFWPFLFFVIAVLAFEFKSGCETVLNFKTLIISQFVCYEKKASKRLEFSWSQPNVWPKQIKSWWQPHLVTESFSVGHQTDHFYNYMDLILIKGLEICLDFLKEKSLRVLEYVLTYYCILREIMFTTFWKFFCVFFLSRVLPSAAAVLGCHAWVFWRFLCLCVSRLHQCRHCCHGQLHWWPQRSTI